MKITLVTENKDQLGAQYECPECGSKATAPEFGYSFWDEERFGKLLPNQSWKSFGCLPCGTKWILIYSLKKIMVPYQEEKNA